MKKFIVIVAFIIASVATAFGQEKEMDSVSFEYDSIMTITNIMGQIWCQLPNSVYELPKVTTAEKIYEKYGVSLDAGLYFVNDPKHFEYKIIVK